jgi:hypothetical protein
VYLLIAEGEGLVLAGLSLPLSLSHLSLSPLSLSPLSPLSLSPLSLFNPNPNAMNFLPRGRKTPVDIRG